MKFRFVCLIALMTTMLCIGTSCERSPEDLEQWRNAEGGYEKIAEWAGSAEEPMPVRERAIQILIEEGQANRVQMILERIEEKEVQAKLADAALPTVQAKWDKQDQPSMKDAGEGGKVAVGESETVEAKDAAFFLQPYAQGETKKKYEEILASWMSEEQDLRTQLGSTTVGQVLPRAGEAGMKTMLAWLEETSTPDTVQYQVLQHTDDPEIRNALAGVLKKRYEKTKPEISNSLEIAMLQNQGSAIVPVLEAAIKDEQTAPKTKDGFMDAIVKIQGDKATSFFADLTRDEKGLIRWVAAQRLIEVRGKAGILAAANALPLEQGAYTAEDLGKEFEITCNFVGSEMQELGIDDIRPELTRALEGARWPAQLMGIKCVEVMKLGELKPKVEALKGSKEKVPRWGDAGDTTVGKIAETVAESL